MRLIKPIPKKTNAMTMARNRFLTQIVGVRHGKDSDFNFIRTDSIYDETGFVGPLIHVSGTFDLLGPVQGEYDLVLQKQDDGRWKAINGNMKYSVHTDIFLLDTKKYRLLWQGDGSVDVFTDRHNSESDDRWLFQGFSWNDRTVKKLS